MKVICKHNQLDKVPKNLRKYAFTQDSKGQLDITPGKEYSVYGVRTNKGQKFYLVNTDSSKLVYPWWMPSELYDTVDDSMPNKWTTKKHGSLFGRDIITAPPAYHGNENAIEDGEASKEILESIIKDSE